MKENPCHRRCSMCVTLLVPPPNLALVTRNLVSLMTAFPRNLAGQGTSCLQLVLNTSTASI